MKLNPPILQVALDITELGKAISIAVSIVSNLPKDHLIIEAGTPLIKKWGVLSIKLLKESTNSIIFADTKTMDVGGLEASIVYNEGADIASVLSVASNETIVSMIEEARRRNKFVAVDLINNLSPLKRITELFEKEIYPDIIIYHVGIDVQKIRGISVYELFDEVRNLIKYVRNWSPRTMVAVAGGLSPGKIRKFVDLDIDIIIVGSAITKSSDPVEVSKTLLKEAGVLS